MSNIYRLEQKRYCIYSSTYKNKNTKNYTKHSQKSILMIDKSHNSVYICKLGNYLLSEPMKISTNTSKDLIVHITLVILLLITFFLAFFFVYLPFTTNHGESITVPELAGMNVEQIEDYLDERNLRYEISDCTFVIDKPPLTVLRQYPKPGMIVKKGRKIYIYITTSTPPEIRMPQVVDRTKSSAEQELKRVGLVVGKYIYEPDPSQSVLKQLFNGKSIQPGQLIKQGSRIDLVLGNGIGNTEMDVPDVIGKTLEEAEFVLKGSNLKRGLIQYEDDPTKQPGTVTRQNPEAGAGNKIRVGEVVDIWVVGQPEQQQPNPNGN
jgi:eukaryotic-like serine/threonine-protein kinase